MGIKEILQNRIEKDAVKSTLSYTKRDGDVITEEVLLKRSKLPLVGDWARIYPPLNEDGSWNFSNLIFGGKKNLYKLLMIMFILWLVYWQVTSIIGESKQYMNPDFVVMPRTVFDKYCKTSITTWDETIIDNITIVNLPIGT